MKEYKLKLIYVVFFSMLFLDITAQNIVSEKKEKGAFALVAGGKAASILIDKADDSLIHITARLFKDDIKRVTNTVASLNTTLTSEKTIIVIGTINSSGYIKQLIKDKKIDVSQIKDKWDGYQVQVVNKPFKGVDQALVIVGSNKRGAAYGTLEISSQMGVSPWYWWADVPSKQKKEVYINSKIVLRDSPKVKYRGIFINDEAPAFSGWTAEKFGGANSKAYVNVFELLLRLKGNYMWPAMWGRAFNDDDKFSPILADRWGIVMGTSHHEPMLRAQAEWKRYGSGAWDYTKNEKVLRDFWRKGIENMGTHESLVTIGMRGDGDEPMTEGTATALLEKIVADQRKILEEVTKKPAAQTPQLWALYKEVQEYYDKGMRVSDDVTLLLCDDNWGNIRKLPNLNERVRSGGYGIYYHFDYVGDPRNYKWINTNNIARVWEQMHLAWEYNVRDIWIVNVGDIKPMEFPISFFLDYAWNPEKVDQNNLKDYYTQWAGKQFGKEYALEIGDILKLYGQYASRVKPELLTADTYSIDNYDEANRVLADFNDLEKRAEKINKQLPEDYRDAYFQLVLHPVKAMANLQEMYNAVALNRKYAALNDPKANSYADEVKERFKQDSLLSVKYNKEIANGKWNHMMDQVHIGYTSWSDPKHDIMPQVKYVKDGTLVKEAAEIKAASKSAENLAKGSKGNVFFEKDGYVAIDAENYSKSVDTNGMNWATIPSIGRTASGISPFPVTSKKQVLGNDSPHTEYDFYMYEAGKATVKAYFSPTLNFLNDKEGLQYAVSIDDEAPQILSINSKPTDDIWRSWVAHNIIIKSSEHKELAKGKHVLKFWMVDAGVVLQKLVIDFGGLKESYLGPQETRVR